MWVRAAAQCCRSGAVAARARIWAIPVGGGMAGSFRRLARASRSAAHGFAVDEATSSIASIRSLSNINHPLMQRGAALLLAEDHFRTASRRLENDFVGTPERAGVMSAV